MQSLRLKSLRFSFAFVFCLLPFALRAQTPTPIAISDAQTTAQSLTAGQALTVESAGSVIVDSGVAVTGAGTNTITNSGAITGATHSIDLTGSADASTLATQATRPSYDAEDSLLDAYYFNNKIINETAAATGSPTATITGAGTGSGIRISGLRAQILNTDGDILATGSGHGIFFDTGSGQGFVRNNGNISAATGNAIQAVSGTDAIVIHNTGSIESTGATAIALQSLNLIVNSGNITATSTSIQLAGAALQATLDANPTRPAYDSTQELRDAYYFNNKLINQLEGSNTGTISSTGFGHGIIITGARAQILNIGGTITSEILGSGINFSTGSSQGFVYNTGSISAMSGNAIRAIGVRVDGITIHNTGMLASTNTSIPRAAVALRSLNLLVNSGTITGASHGVDLTGTADADTIAANPTAPAYNSTQVLRDAYYFNNKVINNAGGVITGAGHGRGISITGARAQILNTGGSIVASETGNGIRFSLGSGQSFIYNAGSITAASGIAIGTPSDINAIVIHNTGTIESTSNTAIVLQSLNLIVNANAIVGGTHSSGIWLQGTAEADTITANPTAPAYDSTQELRDAYYFNNKIINETAAATTENPTPPTATITGKGTGSGIRISGLRTQILNLGGDIVASGSGQSIVFHSGSGQGFVQNSGNITAAAGNAIYVVSGVNAIVIHNTGTIESTDITAIRLQSLNLLVNSGTITGGLDGVELLGVANSDTIAANPTAPAYDASEALRNAYYFNNKVINEAGGSITGKGIGSGIYILGARAQILNAGDITAEGTDDSIYFSATSSGQGFIQNSGSITATARSAIYAAANDSSAADAIVIHNTGTIESTASIAIVLQSLNLIVNSGAITGGTHSSGIWLQGTALQATLDANPTAPAYDSTQVLRDAYYFNNKIVNEAGGTITGKGTGHGIYISSARIQIFNAGDIIAEGTGHGVAFGVGPGQGFIQNSGSITAASGFAIVAGTGIDAITIHNRGTLSSTAGPAIAIESLSLLVNSGDIIAASHGVELLGVANPDTIAANPTAPAYDSTQALRDAYYFNNKIVNEAGGSITGKGAGSGIATGGARIQILNAGDIIAEGTGHGILFVIGAGQGFVQNTDSITAASGNAISAFSGVNAIVIHNDGGTISSTARTAIQLQSLNLIVNSGDITAGTNSDGIQLAGTALQATLDANPTAPAYDATDTDRDAYYFNNKIINEAGGTITGQGTLGDGISIDGARAQILNTGGNIVAEGSGHGIHFAAGSGQGFVYNTGNITTSASGHAINASSNAITIHNDGGTISSTANTAIWLQSLNLIVNSGDITSRFDGIHLSGTADATEVTNNPTAPAYDTADTAFAPAALDAYYFNNKVINEAGGTITGKGSFGDGITINGTRAQILNTGVIIAERSGEGISFSITSGQSFVYNAGRITSALGAAISGFDAITIHNDTGTIGSTANTAIWLQSLNLIVNSGYIRGASIGIYLDGVADPDTIAARSTAPAHDATDTLRDAYYFNNKIINELGGAIVGQGNAHAIRVAGKRAQIFNHGNIFTEGSGHGIYFGAASGESLVVNTGTIRSTRGWGIYAHDDAGGITVINSGTIIGGAGTVYLNGDDTLMEEGGASGAVDSDTTNELVYAPDSSKQFAPSTEPEVTNNPTTDPPTDNEPAPKVAFATEQDDSSSSSDNYQSLFALSDELILDLNAGIQDAIYEHNFSLHSEEIASENTPKKSSFWAQSFGSLRTQDESDDNAKADHTLGGVLLGYDFARKQGRGLGVFLGAALGALDTDDEAELASQSFFGGVNFKFTRDKLFYGVNLTIGFTSHESERSVEESGENVTIEGDYTGFFLSPEFILGLKTQVSSVNITPSLRVRYTFASLKDYDEDGDAESRISVEKRNTGTIESRAQVAFPLGLSSETWKLEPRLGLQYRIDLNKDTFDVEGFELDAEGLETETPIDHDAEKESNLGFFGGLSVQYLKGSTAFKFNVDTIYSDESLILRAQAGFGFAF